MNPSASHVTQTLLIAATLSATPTLWAEDPKFTFSSFGQPISENFNTYQGTAETLPSGMTTSDALGAPNNFRGISNFNDPESPYGNFSAYTSEGEEFSFGIRERSPDVGFQNARLFLPIKNNTGQPIRYFLVSYDVEAWFVGNRRNRIRLKYDDFLTPIEAGRATFETDIFSTDNPSPAGTPVNTRVDGSLSENRVTVEGIVDLQSIDNGSGNLFEALPDGETAWFRWQFSNTSGDAGSLRSGLAVNNIVITPLESFTELEWKPGVGGSGAWESAGGTNWTEDEWVQGATAVFDGTPGVVTLDGAIQAFTVNLRSNYTLDALPGATLLAGTGIAVDSNVTATLSAPIRPDSQLRKIGGGTLLLGSTQNHSGPTLASGGILRPTMDNATSPNGTLIITPGAIFDLNGTTQTIGGLNGERGGLVTLGTEGNLVINTPEGNFAYRADMEGAGNVIKTGPGSQRFRSEKKLYTGFTRIEEGVLEVTGNGEMTETEFIDVMPEGELFMVGSSSSGPPQGFGGPVQLKGGRLAVENTGDEALYFADFTLDVQAPGSTINVSGSESILIMNSAFDGVIVGEELVRKTGAGVLEIGGTHPHNGGMEIRNGSVLLQSGSSIGAGPLLFTEPSNTRSFSLAASAHIITKLDGDAPDQNEPDAVNNLTLDIRNANAVLTVDQAIELDEANTEISTRFQGDITGAGKFVKSGDGHLALTRWPKTYTGATVIKQGVLAVSQPGTPVATSGVSVEPGGQLRLTSTGADVSYQFGGAINLAGEGRGGDVIPESNQGILGALRYEPSSSGDGSTANLPNNIVFDAGDGVRVHVSSAINTLVLGGGLSGSGTGPVIKSGGGALRIAADNAGFFLPWLVQTGTLEVASAASTGSGSVTIGEGAAVAGTGTIGGSLGLMEGGTLATSPQNSGPLLVSGGFSAQGNTFVFVSGNLAAGSFTVLTANGGINGADNLQISGLDGTGFTGTLEVVDDDLLLNLSGGGGITFAQWAAGVSPTVDVNGNGFAALMEFAFGADAPGGTFTAPVQGMVVEDEVEYLTITAVIRTDAPGLVVTGETSIDLGNSDSWKSTPVNFVATANSNVPPNTEERIYRTPMNGTARFIRLRATDGVPAP